MQVIPAKHIGFCFGVKRAISLAREAASQGTVYTYGALIHNGDVIARLEQEGIHAVKTLEEIPQGATAVIRSHGLSPRKRVALESRAGRVLDATCPFVARIHEIVGEQAEADRTILLFGAANHPEVQGIAGSAPNGKGLLGVSDHSQGVGFPDGGRNIAGKNKGSESISYYLYGDPTAAGRGRNAK